MADQEFLQDETLFDSMTEQSEAQFLQLLIEDLFMDNGVGTVFMEIAQVVADVFENSDAMSYDDIGAEVAPAIRSQLHRMFKDMELGEDMLLSKSSDQEINVALARAFRALGDAIT